MASAVRALPPERASLQKAKRVVVKIGSRTLANAEELPRRLAKTLSSLTPKYRFAIVTSGAIAIGSGRLGYKSRPREVGRLQAAAAAGQSSLMRRYEEAFEQVGITTAQVLLTHGDFADRERINNAREALSALFEADALPVINENDTVATEEIRFGDNDQLAALVTPLVGADLLILLTDVDGVLDGKRRRIPVIQNFADVAGVVTRSASSVGTGGMASKLDAARKACHAGANVVIAPAADPGVIARILAGEDVGTLCPRVGVPLQARKHWIAYVLKPKGTLILDDGAVEALRRGRSSLLTVGVLGFRGQFNPGDAVRLVSTKNLEIGRGLTRQGTLELAGNAGKSGSELDGAEGPERVLVHKDDLVVDLNR